MRRRRRAGNGRAPQGPPDTKGSFQSHPQCLEKSRTGRGLSFGACFCANVSKAGLEGNRTRDMIWVRIGAQWAVCSFAAGNV